MHCIYHVKMCIRHKDKNHETSHVSAAIWAKIKCLRNHLDGWLTEDGLFTLSTVKKKGGAHVDECLQLYTLSWSFGTRNQSILSYGIKTYYKSALCQRNRNHQYSKAALSTKQIKHSTVCLSVVHHCILWQRLWNEKKERKKELFYFLHQFCYTQTFPKYIVCTREGLRNKELFIEIKCGWVHTPHMAFWWYSEGATS